MSYIRYIIILLLLISRLTCFSQSNRIKGTVFLDSNKNGIRDQNEKGIKDICVSNGRDVVRTNNDGSWALNAEGKSDLFLIKPADYAVPVNRDMIPQYYFNFRENSSAFNRSIDFPLVRAAEKSKFSAIFFGDPQARGVREVNYINHDVVEECLGTDALFGVSLGDIVADDPNLFAEISQGIGRIGIPWYNNFGNHDRDRDNKSGDKWDSTFNRFFGPGTYAFEYGKVAFISLNNIFFKPDGKYICHLTSDQLSFVKNYLSTVPANKLIVMMMHEPIVRCDNRERLFELIQDRKYTFSISGHAHVMMNLFVSGEQGWKGKSPHHHLVNATVCGSWWCGTFDEVGIPHATMNDGAPNGYSVITFDNTNYSVRFKAARRPDSYQMNIYLPDEIKENEVESAKIQVNVFAGSERSVVEMRLDNRDDWIRLEKVDAVDPECLRMHQQSPWLQQVIDGKLMEDVFGNAMDAPATSRHMWQTFMPKGIAAGPHTITVRTKDMFGQSWQAGRIFRIR